MSYRGTYANFGVADKPTLSARGTSGDPHASGDRQEGAVCQPRLHQAHRRRAARRKRRDPAYLWDHAETRCSSAASAGRKTRSRSGTIAACSIARCGTTGRTPAPAIASPCRATGQSDGKRTDFASRHLSRASGEGRAGLSVQPRCQCRGVLSAGDLPDHRQRQSAMAGQQGHGHGARHHRGVSAEGRRRTTSR